jgi:hypothetical protein
MNKKLKRTIESLSEMDAYMDKNIRSTYIDHIVYKLKRGIYPKGSLERIEKLISRHNKIVAKKKRLLNRG